MGILKIYKLNAQTDVTNGLRRLFQNKIRKKLSKRFPLLSTLFWYPVYGIWYLVYGIWYMVFGIWYLGFFGFLKKPSAFFGFSKKPLAFLGFFGFSGKRRVPYPVIQKMRHQRQQNAALRYDTYLNFQKYFHYHRKILTFSLYM